jgi:hypothetical protein
MSAALRTSSRSTPAGVARQVGPETSCTCAPASAAARAMAWPILPELRLVMPRTGSIASKVGPAVTSTRLPASTPLPNSPETASWISTGSSMRPGPTSPQACSPASGPRMSTPSVRSWARLRWVAACAHISRFIAGATASRQVRARQRVASRSSARPWARRARKSAEAGATQDESGLARKLDVVHAAAARGIPQRGLHRPAGQGLKGQRRHEALCGLGHHHLHLAPALDQQAAELRSLVGGDSPCHSEDDSVY